MFIITAFSGNVNLFFKKILSRRRDGRARASAARLAALALDSMDRGASRLEPTARFCPSPRPRPSPAPAGTAEGPLSIAAALSFASLPCEREGDRRQAVEGFCPQLRPGRGNPRQLRPASSLANRSRIS